MVLSTESYDKFDTLLIQLDLPDLEPGKYNLAINAEVSITHSFAFTNRVLAVIEE